MYYCDTSSPLERSSTTSEAIISNSSSFHLWHQHKEKSRLKTLTFSHKLSLFQFPFQQLLQLFRLITLIPVGGRYLDKGRRPERVRRVASACLSQCNPSLWDARPSSCARGGKSDAARFAGQLVVPTVNTHPRP